MQYEYFALSYITCIHLTNDKYSVVNILLL